MKRSSMFLTLSIVGALVLYAARATAQTDTTFTYQGRLDQSGQPFNGTVELDFALFDAPVGGNQIDAEIMFNSVPIIDGLFTVDLDFGAAAFDNSNRWLRIKVNNMTLSPRQPLSRSPYAIQTRGLFVDEMQNVGIGTTTPATSLDVQAPSSGATPGAGIRIRGSSSGVDNLAYLDFYNGIGTRIGYVGDGGGADNSIYLQSDTGNVHLYTAVGPALTATPSGNVGIGTASPNPSDLLHVVATGNRAIFANNTETLDIGDGVVGRANNLFGYGILGEHGIFGGVAAGFFGDVDVFGTLSKSSGSFKIDHPLDPANKYLLHSFVESPDMMNIYNGNVVTDEKGIATIEMPDWFEALNRDFRYQLTVFDEGNGGDFVQAKVVAKIRNRQFRIRTSAPHTEVSWLVTGVRQDAWAEAHRIPVEEVKVGHEIGHYLHPEVYGLDRSMSVESAREAMRNEQQEFESAKSEFDSDTVK